jgi:hypothetical protein
MMSDTTSILRPFYLVLVVWGETYRNYFLEYCLPTLLAPGNIPAVARKRPMKYLMATTRKDWDAMRSTAIFRAMEEHVEPIFIELPDGTDCPYWLQNVKGHKLCCERITQDRAYRIFTGPDAVFSDGFLARLDDLAASGCEVVLKLTVPAVEEDQFFRELRERDMLPKVSARDSGQPLIYSARQITAASLRSMHDMTAVNEWDAPYFCGYAATPWWLVPGENGILATGLFWDVLLIDYAAVTMNDLSVLDNRGWDGDYNMRAIGHLETIYLVRDTDELNAISWNSMPGPPFARHPLGVLGKAANFRASYWSGVFNDFHRQLFVLPTRIHADPLNQKWNAVEARALRTLLTWLDPPTDVGRLFRKLPRALQIYADLEEKIVTCRLPWWRRNGVVWKVVRLYVLPGVALLLAPRPTLRSRIKKWIPGSGASIRSAGRRILTASRDGRDVLSWGLRQGRSLWSRMRRKRFPVPTRAARE